MIVFVEVFGAQKALMKFDYPAERCVNEVINYVMRIEQFSHATVYTVDERLPVIQEKLGDSVDRLTALNNLRAALLQSKDI